MKRLVGVCAVVALVGLALAWSRTEPAPPEPQPRNGVWIQEAGKNPWNHLRFNNGAGTFRFAIVTDRTGGARAGVFERAVEQLNILQPEFVVSVGDLIQGGTEDLAKLDRQWQEFNGFIAKLHMPFFYVPGNHDIGNKVMDKTWRQRFGRSYYHFVYQDVLFLLLNSEDPPKTKTGQFSKNQITWARDVLQKNAKARWTVVFVHRPVWADKDVAKTGWLDVEQALADRPYTVFAGHRHIYKRFERNGRRYYQLATTGGSSKLRGIPMGEFDHLVWVTMKDGGPVLANLMMEGIFPENLPAWKNPATGVKAPAP